MPKGINRCPHCSASIASMREKVLTLRVTNHPEMTHAELAKLAGCTRPYVSMVLKAEKERLLLESDRRETLCPAG